MKKLYCFVIHPHFSLETAWERLAEAGVEIAYGSEEEETKQIYGYVHEDAIPDLSEVLAVSPSELPTINWEDQWATHGWNFHDGFLHIDLADFGAAPHPLFLQPGPGFGDLSHPTTRLVLQLMSRYVKDQIVIDIGCGSGILTVAAAAMGASYVYGIDIDSEALEHSKENARLNQVDKMCHFCLPTQLALSSSQSVVVLMNMIWSEQQVAWESLPSLHSRCSYGIISGIRQEEKTNYLLAVSKKWRLIEELEEEGWVACVFQQ